MNVYSLYDIGLRQHVGQLVSERNDFGVQRTLSDGLATATDWVVAKHPEGFQLYQVAEFDSERGIITPVVPPRLVVNCAELVSRVKEG